MDQPEVDDVRILSFDGGDLSAVSQLIILDEFMRRVKWDQKSKNRILPCDYFHMMAGVGTGGIMVVLLALLRMETREAIDEFKTIWRTVFADDTLDIAARSERLEHSIKNLLKQRNIAEDRKMCVEDGDEGCRVFVCAVSESDLGHCEKFRNYSSRETSLNPTIVEAVRATCAIPALFKPVRIEVEGAQISYVSGTYNFNNPTGETIKEACEHFGRDQLVACVLSLGCGQRKNLRVPESFEGNELIDLVEEIASDCERVARDLGWRIGKSNVYYRLSDNAQLRYGNGSSRDLIGSIENRTQSFLHDHNTSTTVNKCVEACEGSGRITLMEISGVSENKAASAHGLPSLSAFFVKRPGIIKEMVRGLFRAGPSAQRRIVISGLGGIGKTQVTISFLLQFLLRFRHVLFIDGSSIQSIESGIVAKVKSLGATYSRTSANEALEVLTTPDHEITRDWAIVYDNVDDPKIPIAHYFPQCNFGTLIITTRNPGLGNLAPGAHIRLDTVSEQHAIEILLRSAIQPPQKPTKNDCEHARGIAKALGYLPVALVQAGYFINRHDCMSDYLQRLERRRPQILSRPAEDQLDKHYHGVYASLEVTWPVLSGRAQRFLSTLGFVNYTGLPLVLIYRAAERCFLVEPFQLLDRAQEFEDSVDLLCGIFRPDEDYDTFERQDVDDIVAELEQYSLITRMETFKLKTLRFHPLVQSWIYDRLPQQERGVYQAAAVRLLLCGTGDHDQDVDIFEFAYPHVALLSDRLGRLHVNDRAGLAAIFAHHGDVKTAAGLWEAIYDDLVQSYGENHLIVSVAQLQLAGVYGKFDDEEKKSNALRLESKALELRARKLGPDHPMTIHAFAQMARGVARNRISKPMVVVALFALFNVMERHPSDSWDDIPQSKEVWASAVGIFSKIRAIDGWTVVLEERKAKKGLNHYTTMRAAEALAAAYDSDGTEDSAESDWSLGWDAEPSRGNPATSLWIDLVEEKRRRRGPQHPDTLRTLEGLALAYSFQKMASLSMDRWKEVIILRQEAQGRSHEETLHAMEQLAKTCASCEQYDEAQQLWKSVAALRGQANGAKDKGTIKVMAQSAITYERCKQYEKAEAEWKEVIIRMVEDEGPTGRNTLYAMEKLAKLYAKSGRKTEAAAQWVEVVGMWQEAHGFEHKDTLEAMTELGRAYALCEQYSEAEAQWKQVIELSRIQHGSYTRRAINAMEALANLCEERGQDEKAAEWWRGAIALRKEAKTRFHEQRPDALEHLRQLLNVFSSFKKFANPENRDRKLANLFREFIAPGHSGLFAPGNIQLLAPGNKGLISATLRLAKVCSRSGRYDEAKPILSEVKFKIREGIYDDSDMDKGIGELLELARTLLAKVSGIDASALRDMPLEGDELEYAERRSARGTLSNIFPHLDPDLIDDVFERMGGNLESSIEALQRME